MLPTLRRPFALSNPFLSILELLKRCMSTFAVLLQRRIDTLQLRKDFVQESVTNTAQTDSSFFAYSQSMHPSARSPLVLLPDFNDLLWAVNARSVL